MQHLLDRAEFRSGGISTSTVGGAAKTPEGCGAGEAGSDNLCQ
jgi:hypothetical protein